MTKLPGLPIYHGESETMESSGGLKPGQAVGFDSNGQLVAVSSGQNGVSTVVGTVSHTVDPNHAAGEDISVFTGGTIVTEATSGVTAGDELGASSTAGTLTGGSGAGQSFSDAGGTYQGDIPNGYAAVRYGGVV